MAIVLALLTLSTSASPTGTDFAKMFGLVYNTKYTGALNDNTKSLSHFWNITDSFMRNNKFYKPPASVSDEVQNDGIDDEWDYTDDSNIKFDGFKPIIGILTQPTADSKKDEFNYKDYILEINDLFIKWGGSRTVAIPYNIPERELMKLLPQINGVLFTGGSLELIDQETGEQHQYYKTAKKVYHYSRFMKDVKG